MVSFSSPSQLNQPICPICQLPLWQPQDVFCPTCRARINAQIDSRTLTFLIARLLMTIFVESLFGIFTGFLLVIPIGAVSSGQLTLTGAAFLFGMNLVLIAPIITSLYDWTLRAWISNSQSWALANTFGALSSGLLMFLAVFLGGLRSTTLPHLALSCIVIFCEWCIGVTVAGWQSKLLTPPFQQKPHWQRWSVIGWSIASLLHLGIAIVMPPGDFNLWLGTAAAFLVYGIITHCILAHSALDKELAVRLQHPLG